LVIIALIPTIIYFISIYKLGNPVGNIDVARALGSYCGLFLLALAYTAIGVWTSTFTENQIVAFISSLFISLMLYEGLQYLGNLMPDGFVSYFIGSMSLANHYNSLSVGVLDSRNIVFLLSATFLFLSLTRIKLLARKW
jgi:ABC-2 type transport system permease protein